MLSAVGSAACPYNTDWVLLTNGDNEYASSFFSRIGEVNEADIVAVDFYSRYQRMTGAHPPLSIPINLHGPLPGAGGNFEGVWGANILPVCAHKLLVIFQESLASDSRSRTVPHPAK